jgi:DEAD/DEAH box helicase domain-containing protein
VRRARAPRTAFLADPQNDPELGANIRARYDLPASEGLRAAPPEGLHPDLRRALEGVGLARLYSHQVEGMEHLLSGRDLLVCTPTASGKSLIYQVAALDAWLKDPSAKALFLYPYKALAQDQCMKLNDLAGRLGFEGFSAAIYDGDTPSGQRRKLQKDPPPVLFTNPDMLHLAFLAYCENWTPFFRRLSLLVLDEAHVYRGVFGAHVHHVLKRTQRILDHEGARPLWVATSATMASPLDFYRRLTGRKAVLVEESGAPRPGRRLFLMNASGSPYTLACEVMDRLLAEGARTLAFTKARRVTELVYSWLCQRNPAYRKSVSSYRAGFLPSERRKIEQAFFDGSLLGVVSTSAMETGIDVGGLDACILVGYPGSLISLHQRMGRVGRGEREADIFLIAMPDALDQYFVAHPDQLLDRRMEELVLDPANPYIVASHLLCAARELPLEDAAIPSSGAEREALEALDERGELLLDAAGTHWHSLRRNPHREVNLRTIGEGFTIQLDSGRAVGNVDGHRVYRECHQGAIYLHQGQTFRVVSLIPKDRKVTVEAVHTDYYTEVRSDKETEIIEVIATRSAGAYPLSLGRLKITEILHSYVKRKMTGGEAFAETPLEAPPLILETEGLWIAIPPGIAGLLGERGLHLMGGIHALEHALIGIFPLLALADRWDLGGISYPLHPQVGGPAVFIYDGYPGGAGLCRKGYDLFESLLEATARVVRDCPCELGCPACIQSPKCGNGNKPLDKAAALAIAEVLEGRLPLDAPSPVQPSAEAPAEIPGRRPQKRRTAPGRLVWDVETQRLAGEVGGWGNIQALGLALAVTWDLDRDAWRTYFEEEAEELVEELLASPLVIGFNINRFDLEVVRPYSSRDLRQVRTLDLLEVLKGRLGFRLSLASLAESNFGESKSADGVQSVQWYREGRFDLIEQYCKRDVKLTGMLYRKGLEDGYLLFRGKTGEFLRVSIGGWGQS